MNVPRGLSINWKYLLTVVVILAAVVGGGVSCLGDGDEAPLAEFPGGSERFRNLSVQLVRAVAENYFGGQPVLYPEELAISGDWELKVTLYHRGEIVGEGSGQGKDEVLSLTLERATRKALFEGRQGLAEEALEEVRFLVSFPDQAFSFIEYNGEGKELIGDLVITRNLDKELIRQQIEQGKEFLLRAVHKDEHGFYKKYDVLNDDFGSRLHTVYSASIIYTLLKIYDFDKDERIAAGIADWADFLLSMQSQDKETDGAFHYSYYFRSGRKQPRFVVGTTALSIFTLLDLYHRTADAKYLESARAGGDWLITMQQADGWMKAYKEYEDGEWVYGEKKSLLYNGQVLSAFSRLYRVSGEERYYAAAEKIARRFAERVEREGYYLGDDYRSKNSISSAWVVMSLLDFYRINQDEYYKNIVLESSSQLLERQNQDMDNLRYYGTWDRAYSTSGNGWLAEVMVTVYEFYQEHGLAGADKYREAAVRVTWWIIQNTYSAENTFFLKEPQKAIGGSFWNNENRYVRTDSVCHAVNAYLGIIDDLADGLLLSIPEEPFGAILEGLRK